MSDKQIKIFCPDNAEHGRTKLLNAQAGTTFRFDLQGEAWENLGKQGEFIWWKMVSKSSGAILHDDAFLGYEIE